jgi:hypothetical protein
VRALGNGKMLLFISPHILRSLPGTYNRLISTDYPGTVRWAV